MAQVKSRFYGLLTENLFQTEVKLGEYKAAKKSLQAALTALSSMSNICSKEKEKNATILQQAIDKFSKKEDTKEKDTEATEEPRLTLEEGEEEEGVASCLTLKCTEGAGRHTVANQKIQAGTLLATGEPAVALLNPDNKTLVTQFCLNCLCSAGTPFPCFTCSYVAFCSPSCREKALFHQQQCQLDLYRHRQHDTEVAFNLFLPLKWLWQKPFEFFKENWNEAGELVGKVDLEYKRMWSMVTHLDTRSWASMINVVVVTTFLLRCNRLTSYCPNSKSPKSEDGLSPEEEWLGGILAHIFMVQDMNSHPFFGLDRGRQLNQVGLENLGSAIYPVVGRHFNHSCAPNTIRVNCGTRVFLFASATIEEGEEVKTSEHKFYQIKVNRILSIFRHVTFTACTSVRSAKRKDKTGSQGFFTSPAPARLAQGTGPPSTTWTPTCPPT